MNQKSPKLLITLTILLCLAVASAGGFLVFKDRKIDFGEIFSLFSKKKKQEESSKSVEKLQMPSIGSSPIKFNNAPEETNLTKKLSQSLAATALLTNFDVANLEASPELVDEAFKQAGVDPETVFPLPEISDDEIKIANNNSPEAIEEYVSKMYNLFEKFSSKIEFLLSSESAETSVEIMQQAIDTKNFSQIEELLQDNKKIVEELKKISIPSSWKNIHKEQIALLVLENNIYQAVEETETDSLRAIIALQRYPDIFISMNDLLDKMVALRKAQK
ncbi:MAG: hypothetical protein ABIG90_00575 [bacterium]